MQINQFTYIPHTQPQIQTQPQQKTNEKRVKATVLATSIAGTTAALAIMGKRQNLNIFKPKDFKNIEIGTKELLAIPLGSILGGYAGGVMSDPKNKKAKHREALQQYIGNIIFPVSFVTGANALLNKFSDKIKLPKTGNRFANAVIKAAPTTAVTLTALGSGVLTGNRVMNTVNKHLFDENKDRSVHLSDFTAHVDDILLGATLVAQNLSKDSTSIVGTAISRLIPPALVVPGYMTGTATKDDMD